MARLQRHAEAGERIGQPRHRDDRVAEDRAVIAGLHDLPVLAQDRADQRGVDRGRGPLVAVGVWGIRPAKSDHVVAIAIVDPDTMLLVAGENGIGKRTSFDEYRRQSRGGKGIITMKAGEKTGDVVGALSVRETDELMLITNKGQMVRTRVREIRETGRNTMGVKLMDLRNGEKLQAIAPVVSQIEEEQAQSAEPPAEKS